jgi:hypothetical protein
MTKINGEGVSGSEDEIIDNKDNKAEELSLKNKFTIKVEPP